RKGQWGHDSDDELHWGSPSGFFLGNGRQDVEQKTIEHSSATRINNNCAFITCQTDRPVAVPR
ncbi:MAG: hypothetical protein VW443_09895, partial [Pseudomonadales bacterium]